VERRFRKRWSAGDFVVHASLPANYGENLERTWAVPPALKLESCQENRNATDGGLFLFTAVPLITPTAYPPMS